MYFPSKKDLWMAIIIWLLILLFIIPPIFLLDTGLVGILLTLLPAILLLWIWFKTGYTIQGPTIKIQYGPIKKTLNINEITSIRITKNPFTAPALSMDKIEVNYARFNTVAISPKNKTEFICRLLKQNPGIQIDNRIRNSIED